jgi:cell fate regulator YaaT (PSP1 superfamily)
MLDMPSLDETSDAAVATAVEAPASGYVVRYGLTRFVAEFSPRGSETYLRGAEVIVRSSRGTEWGEVLSPATPRTREFLGVTEPEGRILRTVNRGDREALERTHEAERDAFKGGQEVIRESKLVMQLIDVESLFGGERLVFYYISEQRVDFRELVKHLAKRFHTRIEMRQIGVRDEAKLLADYGDCGKPVCCNTHLREMPPVSMKMAKMQKATLDPNKISGRCGRLKCCLRYEYDTYEAHRKELPKVGATVVTKVGRGRVFAVELLARKLVVQYEDHRRIVTDEKDVLTIVHGSAPETDPDSVGGSSE